MAPKKKKIKKPIVVSTRKTRSQMRQKPTTSNKNDDKTSKTLKGKPGKKKFGKFHCLNESRSLDDDEKAQSDAKTREQEKEEIDDSSVFVDDKSSDEVGESDFLEEDSSEKEIEEEIVASPEPIEVIIENVESMEIDDVEDKLGDELSSQLVNLEVSKSEKESEEGDLLVSVDGEIVVECVVDDVAINEENVITEEIIELKDDFGHDEIDIKVNEDIVEESVKQEIEGEDVKEEEKLYKAELKCAVEMMLEKVEAIEDVKPVVVDKIIASRKSKRISLKAKTKVVETREAKIVESKDVRILEKKEREAIEIKELEAILGDEEMPVDDESESNKKEEELKKKNQEESEEENEVNSNEKGEDEEAHVHVKKSSKKGKDEEAITPMDTDESNSERSEGKRELVRSKKKVKKAPLKSESEEKAKKKKKPPTLKVVPKNKQLKKKTKAVEEPNDDNSIRRSNRIKTISSQKKSSKGKGLVKKDVNADNSDNSNSGNTDEKSSRDSPSFAQPQKGDSEQKPVKVKSRWRRSSELEMNTSQTKSSKDISAPAEVVEEGGNKKPVDEEVERRLKQFVHLKENQYLTERISCKEAKKMTCDCFLTEEEIEQGEFGCGEDCLNRLLMIECGNLCTVSDRCTNKRFQKGQAASCEVFRTDKKGLGIRASANIPYGEFILEYVGEVLDPEEFEDRAADYSKDKNRHYYFMALRADAVIDATQKGNISRFINHSCDPNAETQKWTVNGELRIGFFSKRTILAGEEITFDYQFQRYGKEAQKCFCEAPTCRGWLGEEPDDEDDEEEEEDEEEDEEDEEEEEEEVVTPAVVEPPKVLDGEVKEKLEEEVVPKVIAEEVVGEVVEEGVEKEVVKEVVVEKKKKEKKQKILRPKRKPRKDIFEDLDLDDEIASLQTTGLKNQAHTLKLSRLIVRAKELAQRMKLLNLLKHGELPCRRLFLDYHGLRLMHGWMIDAQQLAKQDSTKEYLRLEILQTVATLPIPNKTMLQDSKVLSIVEKWAVSDKPQDSPMDSESNSPKDLEMPQIVETKVEEPKLKPVETKTKHKVFEQAKSKEVKVEEDSEFDIRRSVGMDVTYKQVHKELTAKNIIEELSSIFDDEEGSPSFEDKEPIVVKEIIRLPPKPPTYDVVVEILALATKLLQEWSSLKEVFRIPKKERIEQMKEHEREADKRYKALSLERENVDKNRENRYRTMQRHRDNERRKDGRNDRHNYYHKISKHERRKIFAMKVEQDEEDRRRKQQEMWRQHEKHCMMMGTDPRFTAPYDPNRGYQCIWNQQIGQWQNYPLPDHPMHPHLPIPNFPYLPPRTHPNIINPQAMQSLPPTHKMPPPILQIPPPNITNIYPPGNLSLPHNIPLPTIAPNIPQAMVPPNLTQPNMPPASMGTMPPMPNIPAMPSLPYQEEVEDPSQVKFMGPIPPPVKLPPKWKCVKDKYGRPYYYHVKFRKSQWQPPEFPPEESEEISETSSSSDTSSLSSDSSSDDSDSDIDDTRLMREIKNKFKRMEAQKKLELKKDKPFEILKSAEGRSEVNYGLAQDQSVLGESEEKSIEEERVSSLDKRLIEELGHSKAVDQPPAKKRRIGLVQEIIISPRNEQDKLQFKEDVRRYRQTKEMLKRQKELIMQQTKKLKNLSSENVKVSMTSAGSSKAVVSKAPKKKVTVKSKLKEMETGAGKKIKENFRMSMAGVMVGFLNSYRKPDCKQGRIANTEDFKHLARKLTHFVMLKELKHCPKIEDLTCTESVKGKAKEFVKKYMEKFGEQYVRPAEDVETYP